MRIRHVLAVAAMVVIALGMKLVFSSPMKAEVDITPTPSVNVLQMQTYPRNMPIQKIRDMTFVFADGD